MQKRKALLIHPGELFSTNLDYLKGLRPQIMTLYSFLRENGVDVDVLQCEEEFGRPSNQKEIEEYCGNIANALGQYDLDIVGISCYTSFEYLASVMVAQICRRLSKDCTIVVGGYHPMAVPDDFRPPQAPEGLFDFLVQGEGELAFLDICTGQHTKKESLQIIEGIPRDLSRGVFLDWENFKYIKRGANHVEMSFSRGCPFRCSFCIESTTNFKYRHYSVDNALREIQRSVDIIDPHIVRFSDPLFRLDTPFGKELLRALVDRKFDKTLSFMTRIDMITKEDITLLSKLNVRLFFGVETFSEKMLLLMNKTKTPATYLKKVEENIGYLNEGKILCDFALLFNYPGETIETVNETFSFMERVFAPLRDVSICCGHNGDFLYLPGTDVTKNIARFEKEFGTIIRHKTWWREQGNHGQLASDVVPSHGLSGKVSWRPRLEALTREYLYRNMSKETMLLKFWFEKLYQTYEPEYEKAGV